MHKLITRFRSKLLVFLTHYMALPVLRIIRSPQKFPYTRKALRQLPEGTLGNELVTMLDKKNLELLSCYARRDIKHILLQYNTTGEGEVCLQCFMLGNDPLSFPVMATVLYGIFTMPEHWGKFRKAWHRGKHFQPIDGWQWFTLLHQPVHSLINKRK